ncbi:hypothetical protein BU16DRAFT_623328 [Lophium mytilinum]|uniref:Zn(2)-C6 fungal-type domain-containing protein n=1 Tax=Lophium mytilinum TaxID=390894 RepID=A0A6A6QAU6_9PEZI|nr:hypothetical protein BU16DRAFT_623328 [Lophium mytilinum]
MDFHVNSADPASASSRAYSNPTSRSAKSRSACNRCHSQKLRCVRRPGYDICERCSRLKIACRYGPRAPRSSLRPLEQITDWQSLTVPPLTPTPNADPDTLFGDMLNNDWLSSFTLETSTAEGLAAMYPDRCYPQEGNCASIMEMSWPGNYGDMRPLDPMVDPNLTTVSEDSMIYAGNRPSPGISISDSRIEYQDTEDHSKASRRSAVHKLATLNVALYECAAQLPSSSTGDPVATGEDPPRSRKPTVFAFDELFRLTTDFIDIVKDLSAEEPTTHLTASAANPALSSSNPTQSSTQPSLPLVTYTRPLSPFSHTSLNPNTSPTIASLPTTLLAHIDEPTLLLLSSSLTRLTTIYASIFEKIHLCLKHSAVPVIGRDWAIVLPRLSVGSIASPPVRVDNATPLVSKTESSLYMLVFTMLAGQLWGQVGEGMGLGEGRRDGDRETREGSGLLDVLWDSVREKVDGMVRMVEETKGLLQRYSA